MSISSRTAVAVHLLALLAYEEEGPLTSEEMAGSVNTNPVVVRRVLGRLRDAGLVSSWEGHGGGWRPARDPARITLLDAYRAVEEDGLFSLHNRPPNPACTVGRNVQGALESSFGEAEEAMERSLGQTTVADVLRAVLARAG